MNVKKDYHMISTGLIVALFSVGIYYVLPMIYVNPYEYLYGSELKFYQVYHFLFSGVSIPLLSLITGFILTREEYNTKNIMYKLFMIFMVLFVCSVLFNGFIVLFIVPIAGLIVLVFRDKPVIISLVTMSILFLLYIIVWTLLPALVSASSNDLVYSSIQELNNYIGVYREKDIISMIELNIDSIFKVEFFSTLLFLALPMTFLGSILKRINIETYFKEKGFIVTIIVLVSGCVVKLFEIVSVGARSGRIIGDNIGGVLLALGIFLSILLMTEMFNNRLLHTFGEFSMLVYILFSVIMAVTFYGFGFNKYGELSINTLVLLIIGIIIVIYLLTLLLSRTSFRPFQIIDSEEDKIN